MGGGGKGGVPACWFGFGCKSGDDGTKTPSIITLFYRFACMDFSFVIGLGTTAWILNERYEREYCRV